MCRVIAACLLLPGLVWSCAAGLARANVGPQAAGDRRPNILLITLARSVRKVGFITFHL